MKQKVFLKTFGCRTNIYDTSLIANNIKESEVVNSEELADIIVINSCTVTNGADKDVKTYINRYKGTKKILFTGCGVRTIGEELYKKGDIYTLFGQSLKENIDSLITNKRSYDEGDLAFKDSLEVGNFIGKTRAFIKVQEGCDFRCSYCIIPTVRGKARSIARLEILEEIRKLVDKGYTEFVFTGTNLGSYGKDAEVSLADLLLEIYKIDGVKRVRLGSLEPTQIDEKFLEVIEDGLFEKHLHIALQYSDDRMLKIMRRVNRFENDLKLFNRLKEKGFALGTDYILGHPGESEEIYENALENLGLMPITHIHAFIYSKRDGTPSATMKEVVDRVKAKGRLNEVKDLIREKNTIFREDKKELKVLVENKKGVYYSGLDQFYNRIYIESSKELSGSWINIKDYEVREDANFARY